MIPRALPEWGMSALTLIAALALGLTGDQRLGIYLVWIPGISLWVLALGWAAVFAALGVAQALVMLLCYRLGNDRDGVCKTCPIRLSCQMKRWRPRLALCGALLWACLAVTLFSGDTFVLASALAGVLAFGEFCLFSALSSHEPWILSFR